MNRKTIFITGAAAGIGRATARRFAREGWFIGGFDLDERGLDTLKQELGAANCVTGQLDVTKSGSVDDALAVFARAADRRLDVLFNCAGILSVGPFEVMARAAHRKQVEVNVAGLIDVTVAAFPLLQTTAGARVISMSSASATYGIPDFATYSATKHAVRALTEALNIEWKHHGIHVCDIMPPFVDTGMVRNASPSKIIKGLGVKLVAEDVAEVVWEAAHGDQIHWPVGKEFKRMWALSNFTPRGLSRLVLERLYR